MVSSVKVPLKDQIVWCHSSLLNSVSRICLGAVFIYIYFKWEFSREPISGCYWNNYLLVNILLAMFFLGFIRCNIAWYLFNIYNFVSIFLKTKLSSSQGCLRKFDFKVCWQTFQEFPVTQSYFTLTHLATLKAVCGSYLFRGGQCCGISHSDLLMHVASIVLLSGGTRLSSWHGCA